MRFDLFPSDDPAWRAELLAAQEMVAHLAARVAVQLPVRSPLANPGTAFRFSWFGEDALDAHSIAIVAVRTKTLRVLRPDGELEALRMLCDRREELTRLRVQTVNRLQRPPPCHRPKPA